jgi:hypothetical protein
MSYKKDYRDIYKKEREALFDFMGSQCADCGNDDFSCLCVGHPRGYIFAADKINSIKRLEMYLQEFIDGDASLLCRSCCSKYKTTAINRI